MIGVAYTDMIPSACNKCCNVLRFELLHFRSSGQPLRIFERILRFHIIGIGSRMGNTKVNVPSINCGSEPDCVIPRLRHDSLLWNKPPFNLSLHLFYGHGLPIDSFYLKLVNSPAIRSLIQYPSTETFIIFTIRKPEPFRQRSLP